MSQSLANTPTGSFRSNCGRTRRRWGVSILFHKLIQLKKIVHNLIEGSLGLLPRATQVPTLSPKRMQTIETINSEFLTITAILLRRLLIGWR